jgi:hypothetical protein
MVHVGRTMAVSLLLASACNGSWRPGGADARDVAVPMVFDDAAAAAHENDASPDRPDASPDLHEVAIDVSEAGAEAGAEAGSDVAP